MIIHYNLIFTIFTKILLKISKNLKDSANSAPQVNFKLFFRTNWSKQYNICVIYYTIYIFF